MRNIANTLAAMLAWFAAEPEEPRKALAACGDQGGAGGGGVGGLEGEAERVIQMPKLPIQTARSFVLLVTAYAIRP